MQMLSRTAIEEVVLSYHDPVLGQFLTPKALKNVEINATEVQLSIALGFPAARYQYLLKAALEQLLKPLLASKSLEMSVQWQIEAHTAQAGQRGMEKVKNIIAIASAKGGVGKSTTAVNLALALIAEGAKVGILDADIYGPSQPMMLGLSGAPEANAHKMLVPMTRYGVQSMSIGYLVDQAAAVAWRGPMVSRALQQLLNDTAWKTWIIYSLICRLVLVIFN